MYDPWASAAHRTDTGTSMKAAMAMATSWAGPGADVVTSNHASTKISVAVTVAARQHRWSRRSSSVPVASRPIVSIASSPTQAVDQCTATVLAGSSIASRTSQGIIPRPATTRALASHCSRRVPGAAATAGRRGPDAPGREVVERGAVVIVM